MYTGIVQALAPVVRVDSKPGLKTYAIEIPDALRAGLELGARRGLRRGAASIGRDVHSRFRSIGSVPVESRHEGAVLIADVL